jgi:hypothetical protein
VLRQLALLAVALAACSNDRPPTPLVDAGAATDTPAARCAVRFEGDASILLRTSERRRLRVVLDPAIPGVAVRLGVVGLGLDASLADTRVLTGPDGAADTELTAPTDSATFRVRATAECGAEATVAVAVGDRGFGSIAADAVYQGARTPQRLELNLASGAECPTMGGDPARRTLVPLPGAIVRFGSLPADLTFTVWAQAIGADDVVLAQGCAAPQTIHADQAAPTSVLFVDRPLRLADRYTLDLTLDLAATAGDLRARWTAPVRRDLLEAGSTAAYIAREVSRAVGEAGGADGGASALQAVFEAALRAGLGPRFDAELTARGLQLEDSFDQIADTTARALRTVHWQLTLPAPLTGRPLTPSESVVVLDPGTPDVARDDARLTLPPEGSVALTVGGGDIVTLALDNASLPWARLARGALGAVTLRLGASTTGEYAAAPLCPVAAAVLRDASGVCDAACIQVACRRAIDTLARAFDDEVASHLATRSATSVRMAAVATPIDHTLVVDRAQGTFVGQWTSDPTVTLGGPWLLQRSAPTTP